MDRITMEKVPQQLRITTLLSCSITIVVSIIYAVLCVLALLFRYNCMQEEAEHGSQYFMNTLLRAYIQEVSCQYSEDVDGITPSHTIFVFVAITLGFSVVSLLVAMTFISMIQSNSKAQQLYLITYAYVGLSLASLVVDITFSAHFGIDQANLKSVLDLSQAGDAENYQWDVLRFGALVLMTVALKGYVVHLINLVLLILIVTYLADYNKQSETPEHSIHKLGPLNAFEQQKNTDDPWPVPLDVPPFTRGLQTNPMFIEDEPPRSPREIQRSNNIPASGRSWQHRHPAAGSRPFSYIEDANAPPPLRSPVVSLERQWRNDNWSPQPQVPAPDYSPVSSRRLKPALKSYT